MKVVHKQMEKFGCSFYCLANLLNLTSQEVENCISEISTHPRKLMNEFYENQFLRRWREDLYFLTTSRIIKNSQDYAKNTELLGCNMKDKEMDKEAILYNIYLVSVQLEEQHRILILRSAYSNLALVIDPEKEDILETTCKEIFNLYNIRSVSVLIEQKTGNEYYMDYKSLAHIIPV